MMATRNLAWMPTLSYDTQAVLATDKVRFQGQEVACVIADDPYIAKDACEAIVVDYEPLPVIVNPAQAMAEGAPLIRDDKENQPDNVVYEWEVGDKAGTDRAFEQADVVSKIELHYPRSHPSPLECCGSIADFDRATSKLTVYMTTQAPHIVRAAVALIAELPEHMIRIISPDLGGGFGNKVPVYPGYVMSILASILTERPVKWVEDRSGNLISTGFGRDVYLRGEMALRRDGRILGVRMHTDADHGAFFADAQPSKFKIGLMHSAFACYDIPAAHLTARGLYTNKAPGGVAYRCSFRVTGRCSSRNAWSRPPPTIWAWTRRSSGASTSSGTTTSRTVPRSASSPTPVSTASASTSAWRPSATRTSCGRRKRPGNAAGCSASASPR
jgi:carbon-monoxide dehydrogenase large subunit